MKNKLKILIFLFILMTGCSTATFSVYENQIDSGMKPFMERSEHEEKINIAIPVYKF